MKKSIIILLSVLAMAFTFSGCGGSEGSISSGVETSSGINVENPVASDNVANNGDTSVTVARTPYVLSDALGTPPGIPTE